MGTPFFSCRDKNEPPAFVPVRHSLASMFEVSLTFLHKTFPGNMHAHTGTLTNVFALRNVESEPCCYSAQGRLWSHGTKTLSKAIKIGAIPPEHRWETC